jgi:hypothetical protein
MLVLFACACGGAATSSSSERPDAADGGVTTAQKLEQQLAEAERQHRELLEAAIAKFEQFLADKPDSPQLTPDAMLRLAELYRDRVRLDRSDQ